MAGRSPWLLFHHPNASASRRLFCFPYAGASATVFRSWAESLPESIALCVLQLPGRAERLREPTVNSMDELVRQVVRELEPYLEMPCAFFGHSIGALAAFKVARALERRALRVPELLFVSAAMPPRALERQEPWSGSDVEICERMRALEGTPEDVLGNQELMALIMPAMRADLQIRDTYRYRTGPPLAIPIRACAGRNDRFVTLDEMAAWREYTSGSFDLRVFEGGHLFLHDAGKTLPAHIDDQWRTSGERNVWG